MVETWTSKLGNKFSRTLINKLDRQHHQILQQLRKQPANSRCAECEEKGTSWASVNIGAFLCVQCADVHRGLGTHVSKVKGCSGTYLWGPDEIARMQEMGNAAVNAQFGGNIADTKPAAHASKEQRLEICRRKYEQRVWVQPAEDARLPERGIRPSTRVAASVRAVVAAPSETSLLDDLFSGFVPEEVASARRQILQSPCFSTTPQRHAARPLGRELAAKSSLFDELFAGFDAGTEGHGQGNSITTSLAEKSIKGRMLGSEAIVSAEAPLIVAEAPAATGVPAHQVQANARSLESFGDSELINAPEPWLQWLAFVA